ncbi:MAG: peptidoglycan editing factor PgeF [Nitrolancea sp.]
MAVRSTLPIFRFDRLSQFPLRHGITGRHAAMPGDGDVNIAGRIEREQALGNRIAWAEEIGIEAESIVSGRQVHGSRVEVVDGSHRGCGAAFIDDAIPSTDALVTRTVSLPLLVYTADCVPLIAYDPSKHALGVAHAGWRGTVANVAGALVETMHDAFASNPADLIVGIGPSIGPCCYEVGDEVIDAWRESGIARLENAISKSNDRPHLDLWRANELALERVGVPLDHIEHAGICTRCESDRYFSRRAGVGHRGLFATIAALAPLSDSRING